MAPEKARPARRTQSRGAAGRESPPRLPGRPLNPRRAQRPRPLPFLPRRGDLLVRRHVLQHLELGARRGPQPRPRRRVRVACAAPAARPSMPRDGEGPRPAGRSPRGRGRVSPSLLRGGDGGSGLPARGEKMAAASAEAGRLGQGPGRPGPRRRCRPPRLGRRPLFPRGASGAGAVPSPSRMDADEKKKVLLGSRRLHL